MPSVVNSARHTASIRELYGRLGYGGSENGRSQAFLAISIDYWRFEYVSEDGESGQDIRKWEPGNGNQKLRRMAQKFLEAGYGSKHWPVRNGRRPGAVCEYPKDDPECVLIS